MQIYNIWSYVNVKKFAFLYSFLINKFYNKINTYIHYKFFNQIWFGECNYWLLKVKNSCCVCREFLTFNAYQLNLSYQIWVRLIFVYQKSLKLSFKTGFQCKITFLIYFLALWTHRGYYIVKKLVWNVRIQAFWYTKNIMFYFIFPNTNRLAEREGKFN